MRVYFECSDLVPARREDWFCRYNSGFSIRVLPLFIRPWCYLTVDGWGGYNLPPNKLHHSGR